MFLFKKPGESKAINPTSLPSTSGAVRTFKKDFENFGKGVSVKEEVTRTESFSSLKAEPFSKKPENNNSKKIIREVPLAGEKTASPENPFKFVPTPAPVPPVAVKTDLSVFESPPSQNFFEEKTNPPNNTPPEIKGDLPLPQKTGKRIGSFLVLIFVLLLIGGGAYYYWPYLKNTFFSFSSSPATPNSEQATTTASESPENKNLKSLMIDVASATEANQVKNTVQKYTSDFSNTAAENDLVEIKIINKDGQSWKKDAFLQGMELKFAEKAKMKLSEDFSLFVRKEEGTARLGLVFKTVTSSGLVEEMRSWEPTMANDLKNMYSVPATSPARTAFNSGRYKSADIRYYNFSSPANTSLDYSVISNFLVISTSKNSMRAILDYMAGK